MTEPLKTEPVEPPQPWRRLASLAGAVPVQTISVAGAGGLDAMVALCRDGYRRVECVRQATCPSADEASDVLLIDGVVGAEAIVALVGRTVRLLRDGGVLAIRLASTREQRVVAACLAAAGYQILGCACDAGGRLAAFTVARAPALKLAS